MQELSSVGDAEVGKLSCGSKIDGECNIASTSTGAVVNDAGAGPSFV